MIIMTLLLLLLPQLKIPLQIIKLSISVIAVSTRRITVLSIITQYHSKYFNLITVITTMILTLATTKISLK